MRSFLFYFFILVFVSSVSGAEEQFVVGDFSGQYQAGQSFEFWQPLEFDGVDAHTVYTPVVDENIGVVQAESVGSSSGLVRKVSINVADYPIISWRWKIEDSIESANLTRKTGDDAPARLYITFAYDSSHVGWLERVKFEAINLLYGDYPPNGALTYVWASHVPKGTVLDSPYTDRVKMIVLQSGADKKGQWVSEKRNIGDDYHMAFDTEEIPLVSGVAIMTDTDNTGSKSMAWYGDIIFHR